MGMKNYFNLKMSPPTFLLLTVIYLNSYLIGTINCELQKARLEILPKQDIQRKPVGKSLMLTCRSVAPDPNLVTDLQWRDPMNNTVLPKTDKYIAQLDSMGGRKPSAGSSPPMYTELLPGDNLALIIPSLQEAMAGRYYCTASYANTEMLDENVQIETYMAITWTDAPDKQFPILGIDYKVKCQVTASPPPSIDWLRNEDTIRTGNKYVIATDGLLIRNVQESDDGLYTCRAFVMQTGELDERHIHVEVYIKPVIHDLFPEFKAVEGQSFSASCNATGKPVPEISWVKEQSQQNVATADRFQVDSQTGRLTITRVEQEDHGVYTCMARNAAGVAETRTKISVQLKPKIFELFNITGIYSKEVAITCRAKGRPAPEITFKRWGSDELFVRGVQPDDDRIILDQHFDQDAGESSGTLRISKALVTDDGLYQCLAKNEAETAYRTGHITIEYPPNFDHMKEYPPVFSWEQRQANLTCLAMSMPNATIEWRWNGRLIKDIFDKNLDIIGNGPQSSLIVRPVSNTYYSRYKCIATNRHGTAEIDMQLKEANLPDYIQSARVKVVTATTITFEILGPAVISGLPVLSYKGQWKEENGINDWNNVPSRVWSPDSPYIVEGLRPQTSYIFRFAATNMVGTGGWGATVTQSTPKRSAPEEPKVLHSPVNDDENEPIVVSPYSDHFELRWNIPADNGEPIDFYQVKFCPGQKIAGVWNENEQDCRSRDVIETTTFEMSNLSGNTYYRIELRAHNAIGFSTPASLYMKTARDNPYNGSSGFKILNNNSTRLFLLILLATTLAITSSAVTNYSMTTSSTQPINIISELKSNSQYLTTSFATEPYHNINNTRNNNNNSSVRSNSSTDSTYNLEGENLNVTAVNTISTVVIQKIGANINKLCIFTINTDDSNNKLNCVKENYNCLYNNNNSNCKQNLDIELTQVHLKEQILVKS